MSFLGTGEPKIGQKVRFSDFIPFSGTKKSEYLELGGFHRISTLTLYCIHFFEDFPPKGVLGSTPYEHPYVLRTRY